MRRKGGHTSSNKFVLLLQLIQTSIGSFDQIQFTGNVSNTSFLDAFIVVRHRATIIIMSTGRKKRGREKERRFVNLISYFLFLLYSRDCSSYFRLYCITTRRWWWHNDIFCIYSWWTITTDDLIFYEKSDPPLEKSVCLLLTEEKN